MNFSQEVMGGLVDENPVTLGVRSNLGLFSVSAPVARAVARRESSEFGFMAATCVSLEPVEKF